MSLQLSTQARGGDKELEEAGLATDKMDEIHGISLRAALDQQYQYHLQQRSGPVHTSTQEATVKYLGILKAGC